MLKISSTRVVASFFAVVALAGCDQGAPSSSGQVTADANQSASAGAPSTAAEVQSAPAVLAAAIDFSSAGNAALFLEGPWNEAEVFGRWALDGRAALTVVLDEMPSDTFQVGLTMGAFIHELQPLVRVAVSLNGTPASVVDLTSSEPGRHVLEVPASLVGPDRRLNIQLTSDNLLSPQEAGLNADGRRLSFSVLTMDFVQPSS